MGIFSKGPSVQESFGYALQAFGMGILGQEEASRSKISSVALGGATHYLGKQSFSESDKKSMLTMFQVVSGTVGLAPSSEIETYGKAQEVSEIIESTLPFNMPMVVMGPIRMVIEEYITGQKMDEIDYEKFDGSPARLLVNALMKALDTVNTRCVQEPRKHSTNEVMCIAYLASTVAEYAKEQLSKTA